MSRSRGWRKSRYRSVGVDFPARVGNDNGVGEILLQCPVNGVQQTGTGCPGQRDDVRVIRLADALFLQDTGNIIYYFIIPLCHAASPDGCGQPFAKIGGSGLLSAAAEFVPKLLASDD